MYRARTDEEGHMQWRTSAVTAGSWVAALLISCDPGQDFCPAESVVCTGDGCADAGAPETTDCITFAQAAALAEAGVRGVHQLTTAVEPARYGFVSARATDTRAICEHDTCYLFPDGSVALWAVPDTQVQWVGWKGCSSSDAAHLTVSATGKDIQCTARFAPAFIIIQASSSGFSDAPIHVTTSSGCDSTNGCVVRYGGSVTLTAPTNPAYEFIGWTGCASSTAPVLVLPSVVAPLPACVAQYLPL